MFLVILACGSAVLAGPSIGELGIGLCFGFGLVLVSVLCHRRNLGVSYQSCRFDSRVVVRTYIRPREFSEFSLKK